MSYWYLKVSPRHVNWQSRQLAERALAYAVRDLALKPVTIQWCLPVSAGEAAQLNWRARLEQGILRKRFLPCIETAQDAAGWCDLLREETIYLRSDLEHDIMVRTVLHEARHVYQATHFRPPLTLEEGEVAESDAEAYAVQHADAVRSSMTNEKGESVCRT